MSRNNVFCVTLKLLVGVSLTGWVSVFGQFKTERTAKPDVSGNLTLMGFTLGKSTIADVEAKLGKSVVRRCSREDEASNEICYDAAGNDRTKVVFEAGFSGGWTIIDGFKVMAIGRKHRCYRACAKATRITIAIKTDGGLKLRLSRQRLIALLGPPSKSKGNRLIFEWRSRQQMTKQEIEKATETFKSPVTDPYYDVLDIIEVTLAHSKVIAFEVHHTVTY